MKRHEILIFLLGLSIPLMLAAGKVTERTAISTIATDDAIGIVDISDTTQDASGTSKKMTPTQFKTWLETYFLSDVVDDTTPELGGSLDIGVNSIEGVNATEFGYLDGVTEDIQTHMSNTSNPHTVTGAQASFADGDSNFTATNVEDAIEEFDDVINGGLPNAATGKVDWSQVVNMPAGFADGTDDGAGGAAQTPWAQDIDGGLFDLNNVTDLEVEGTLTVDTITEDTVDAGVTIESISLEDGAITQSTNYGLMASAGGLLVTAGADIQAALPSTDGSDSFAVLDQTLQ